MLWQRLLTDEARCILRASRASPVPRRFAGAREASGAGAELSRDTARGSTQEHRTDDPSEADYFFVPVYPMGSISTGLALLALQYVAQELPWWNATAGVGYANHIVPWPYDFGGCTASGWEPARDRMVQLGHFGLTDNAHFYYLCRCALCGPAYRPGQDLLARARRPACKVAWMRSRRPCQCLRRHASACGAMPPTCVQVPDTADWTHRASSAFTRAGVPPADEPPRRVLALFSGSGACPLHTSPAAPRLHEPSALCGPFARAVHPTPTSACRARQSTATCASTCFAC